MFNIEEGKFNFESVEEVKEFLLNTENVNVLGVICLVNEEDPSLKQEISISTLIKEKGIDETAEFLFNMMQHVKPEVTKIPFEKVEEIVNKSLSGAELTSEEERILNIAMQYAKDSKYDYIMNTKDSLYNGITVTLLQTLDMDKEVFSTVGGIATLLCTYMECCLVSSDDKLKRAFSNEATANDILQLAESKIHVDEDMSPEMAILGLIQLLSSYACKKEIRRKHVNFDDIIDMLKLDREWITETIKELYSNSTDDCTKCSNENESDSNTDNITDIRAHLNRK